jgi:hypothetical protein
MAEDFKTFHESLERDLARLAMEVRQSMGEKEKMAAPERDIVRRSLEKFAAEIVPTTSSGAPSSPANQGSSAVPLPSYLLSDKNDPRVRLEVERLVDLVFHESLEKAVKEAKRYPPFILDAFHDVLTDKLVPILIERGVLKP